MRNNDIATTGFGGASCLKRGDVIDVNGKQFKIRAVRGETIIEIEPMTWCQKVISRTVWYFRFRYEAVRDWIILRLPESWFN